MSIAANFILFTICFVVTYMVTGYVNKNNSNRLFNANGELAGSAEMLLAVHFTAIVFLGLIPLLFFRNHSFALLPANNNLPLTWILLFTITLILIVFTGIKSGSRIFIRHDHSYSFSQKFLTIYYPIRILFLGAYELFFRGFLLFELYTMYGIITAITISTLLTVLIHVFTNKQEMLACIPFGVALSFFCISINAVWPAIILHIALSFSYELPPVQQFLTQLKPGK